MTADGVTVKDALLAMVVVAIVLAVVWWLDPRGVEALLP